MEVARRSLYLENEGFYHRKERGWGKFMEWREIQAYPSPFVSHVLRSKGISTRDGRIQGCTLMVDGMRLDWDDLRIDDIMHKKQMLALEIHAGMVPVELRGATLRSSCAGGHLDDLGGCGRAGWEVIGAAGRRRSASGSAKGAVRRRDGEEDPGPDDHHDRVSAIVEPVLLNRLELGPHSGFGDERGRERGRNR